MQGARRRPYVDMVSATRQTAVAYDRICSPSYSCCRGRTRELELSAETFRRRHSLRVDVRNAVGVVLRAACGGLHLLAAGTVRMGALRPHVRERGHTHRLFHAA